MCSTGTIILVFIKVRTLVIVGFDASYADPLSATILSSNDFRYMATSLIDAAGTLCAGRIAFMHEGGYSEIYVPFCGAAVIEAMLGVEPQECIEDPFIDEVSGWAGQEFQGHQCEAVDEVAVLHNFTRPVYPRSRRPPFQEKDSWESTK